jgi:hypothetical protein
MIAENIEKIDGSLNKIFDEYVNEILQYLDALQLKPKFGRADHSSMLLSEQSLAKEWLSKEEEEA